MVAPERSSCRSVSHLFQLAPFLCPEWNQPNRSWLETAPSPAAHSPSSWKRLAIASVGTLLQIEESLC